MAETCEVRMEKTIAALKDSYPLAALCHGFDWRDQAKGDA